MNKEGGNTEDRIRGWVDVPLNDQGKKDAANVATQLSSESPEGIVCSDLSRAVDTAKIINKKFKVPLLITMSLRPWNLGIYQGQESKKVLPEMTRLIKNPTLIVPKGESFQTFGIRFLTSLNAILKDIAQTRCDVFIVSHYRNARLAQAWVAAGMNEDLSYDVKTMMEDSSAPGEFIKIRPKGGK